ncbi:hypothetical protein M0Q28_06000 [Patescibacteria group bacterium]|jgi:hypothetical protein|nr:hypothetical protein [Patescibacteria group bacterium]
MSTIENSPVKGYTDQTATAVDLVNKFKILEERLLREIDALNAGPQKFLGSDGIYYTDPTESVKSTDPRWLAVAKTHFQEGFMALNRSVFQPQRISLPEDFPKGN